MDPYTSVSELTQKLAGHWLYCGFGSEPTQTTIGIPNVIGVEATSDQHLYWLIRDASGNAVRANGIYGEAGFDITPPYDSQVNNVSFQITAWYADKSQMDTRATFETGPRRLTLEGIDGYFVSLD